MVEEIPEQNILERKTTNRKCFRKIGTVSVKKLTAQWANEARTQQLNSD